MKDSHVSIGDPATSHEDRGARSPSFFADRDPVRVDAATVEELKAHSAETGQSARLCMHRGPEDALHDSVIVLRRDRFSPPHRHAAKAESYQVIEGETLICVFDDAGRVTDACRLGAGGALVYRVGPALYHANLPLSDPVVVRESTTGPYVRELDMVVAPWAPEPDDRAALLEWRDRLLAELAEAEGKGGSRWP